MPSFSKLFKDKKSGPKSPELPKSPEVASFCKTEKNSDHLNQCVGCRNVERLIRRNVEQQRNNLERIPTAILHNSFEELQSCAQKCEICRVFRQALTLSEVTFDAVEELRKSEGEVIIRWDETFAPEGAIRNSLKVELKGQLRRAGVVNCNSRNDVEHLALCSDVLKPTVIEQAKEWLNTCLNTHIGTCDNLNWNGENPKLLIEILSPTTGRLREDQDGDYVALSYCWGMGALTEAGLQSVERGKTVMANLEQRLQSFSISDLPATVRDALHIIYDLGVRYAWIDSICIVQDRLDPVTKNPQGIEAMHLVYSNALFTLCACSTTRATATLLDTREAWTQRTEPCRLGGQWLTTPDMSLTELRLQSPLAGRAWTLQEERLSPRMLYVSNNRLHWACASGDQMEMRPTYSRKVTSLNRPLYAASKDEYVMPMAQEFLVACWSGTGDLHTFWADIVKSYAARSMSVASDRLTALSGVAAKYLNANKTDEYLAGLWADHLAEGLAWRVREPVQIDRKDPKSMAVISLWPSWSWAVLPPPTQIDTIASGAKSSDFERIVDPTEAQSVVKDPITRGNQVKEILVSGRTRLFWTPSSVRVEWSTFSRLVSGEERFSFAHMSDQDVYAVDPRSGRILVHEARKKEVIGQLDFQEDVNNLLSGHIELKALELGTSTILLLHYSGEGKWRRVGVAWDVRRDFFASTQIEPLALR